MTARIASITILHRDEHLLAVSKPAGLLSVPGRGPDLRDCLVTRLKDEFPGVRIVHRLDRDTSGVMILALDPDTHRQLSAQFERREVHKRYIARVAGRVTGDIGRIDLPLRKDLDRPPRHRVDHDPDRGKPAVTDWRVIVRGDSWTQLELTPHTGRSHQLRVHCHALGHSILGDPLYGDDEPPSGGRLMLHAESLTVTHPHTRAHLTFEAPHPF
jgi:tRNA pseudouridine32 synthase/23S rRNA pseudouridine746 synthase